MRLPRLELAADAARAAMVALAVMTCAALAAAQRTVSFASQDDGIVYADLYGSGAMGLVLAHGGQFNKESWKPQAERFAAAGFHVLALDFRSYGNSHGPGDTDINSAPLDLDVLAAVRYLHAAGAKTVSVVGASMGASAAGDASIRSAQGEIDKIVLLSEAPNGPADKLKSPTLWIVARGDKSESRVVRIRAQFARAPQPKKLIVLSGSAHAQFLFATGQAQLVMREMLRFLAAR
jgi:pimeloyl-ACP methyl ester carboxylesterase